MDSVKIAIFRDGVSNASRMPAALDPERVRLDDRRLKERFASTLLLAGEFSFYNNLNLLDGDWTRFFETLKDNTVDIAGYVDLLLDLPEDRYAQIKKRDLPPHISLYLAFLVLTGKISVGINQVPGRHLDYFIHEILQFRTRPGSPDRASIVLELAKNASPYKIAEGTPVLAGKGFNGEDLVYKTEKEIVVNHARVSDWLTSFRNPAEYSKIYITSDKKILKNASAKIVDDEKGWQGFAEGRLRTPSPVTTLAEIGWAVESPVFYMTEGERTAYLDIDFVWLGATAQQPNTAISIPLEAYITTAEGWLQLEVAKSEYNLNGIIVGVTIPAYLPAIVPGTEQVNGEPPKWPVLKLLVNVDNNTYSYDLLKNIGVQKIAVTATVDGMKNMAVYTPAGQAVPGAPFYPFGLNPHKGDKFYVGVNELRYKNISGINITYKWKGAPDDFGTYYKEYFYESSGARPPQANKPIPIDNGSYAGRIDMLKEGQWSSLNVAHQLFPQNPSIQKVSWSGFTFVPFSPTEREKGIQKLPDPNASPQNGYLSVSFDLLINNSVYAGPSAFGQTEYPRIFSEIAMGKVTSPGVYQAIGLPNAPYLPEVESLTMNYTSAEEFSVVLNDGNNRFFHVSSFGVYEPHASESAIIPRHVHQGYIYIGIENLVPPQSLGILLQLKEKAADISYIPDNYSWSYLSGSRWIRLDARQVISDQTLDLKTSGIIELAVPADASSTHFIMPAGKHWIRLEALNLPRNSNLITDIQLQAVTVVYTGDILNKNSVLPPGSITSVNNDGSIKSLKQYFPSFGGKNAETETSLQVRAHERLRHRGRAVNYWDYERLVLDYFPEIYKVKTLQCTDKYVVDAPGHVTVVVIPDQRGNNMLEPRCNEVLLEAIGQFGRSCTPAGMSVHAVNAVYEPVVFDFYVAFLPGKDAGYYQQQLNNELIAFISPWAFEGDTEIYFGSIFFKTDIIKFIESRDYVDYVLRFEMYSAGGESAVFGIGDMQVVQLGDLEELDDFIVGEDFQPGIGLMEIEDDFIVGHPVSVAVASSPAGILVSIPQHRIRIIEPGTDLCAVDITNIGIGAMVIDVDFVVS